MLTLTPKPHGIICNPPESELRPLAPQVIADIDRNSFIHFIGGLYAELTKVTDGHSVSFHNQSAGVLISIGEFLPEAYSVKFSSLDGPLNETRSFTGNSLWALKHATIDFLAGYLPINVQ